MRVIVDKYYNLAKNRLFSICRSITGKGIKKTLEIIKLEFPKLTIKNIPSGTKVFDWRVPPEWNIYDAYVLDKDNNKIIDFNKNNLHIVGYSHPINRFVTKKEILNHIFSLPKQPNAIPYITSYYKKYWGFCITNERKNLIIKKYKNNEKFKVVIKAKLNPRGSLVYGDLVIKGRSQQEILISTYVCHPSMANNELSGPILAMCLIKYFQKSIPKKTLRFVFLPETIGSITYINQNLKKLKKNVIGGFNLTCVGDERDYSYISSKYENSHSDKAIIETYKKLNINYKKYNFLKRGSDERQYNSPGVDLGIVTISRTKFGEYPEYHTSLDNFNVVTKKGILGSFRVLKMSIDILSKKIIPKSKFLCEPMMSKRSLYPTLSNSKLPNYNKNQTLMDFLQYADGKNSLDDISAILNINKKKIFNIHNRLKILRLISS
jgi:aminopeptidase-like protein